MLSQRSFKICVGCFRNASNYHINQNFALTGRMLSSSVKAEVVSAKEEEKPEERHVSLYMRHKRALEKKVRVKQKREPFMKNLFYGKFDHNILAFSEILDNHEIEALNKMSDQVRKYVLANVAPDEIDQTGCFPESVLGDLKKMGLFGSRVPLEYGGQGLTATEHVRLMEACSVESSLGVLLNGHSSIAAQGLLNSSSDHMINHYLPRVASGELTATLCVAELQNEKDISDTKTVATKNKDDNIYYVTGRKEFVVNAANADLFVVFAKLVDPDDKNESEVKYIALLLEKDFSGIKIGPADNKMGIRGANTYSIEFTATPVPAENVIGSRDTGHDVVSNIIFMSRLHAGAIATGLAKSLVELTADYGINTKQFLRPLTEFESFKNRIGNLACKVYAMESVTYFTAGLFDSTSDPDLNMEYSAVKVFCSEGLLHCAKEVLNIIGRKAYLTGHPAERAIRDAYFQGLLEGSNDMIRQYIAAAGLDHIKKGIADTIEKMRNPAFHPMFMFQRFWQEIRFEKDSLKLKMDLQGYLHPSLVLCAGYMDYSVQKFLHATETVLRRRGREVLNDEVSLNRLANIAIEIYVMAAVCSRASRSYCIGLPSAATEITLAIGYCHDAYGRVSRIHKEVHDGPVATTDLDLQKVSKEVIKKKDYCFIPPYSRTY